MKRTAKFLSWFGVVVCIVALGGCSGDDGSSGGTAGAGDTAGSGAAGGGSDTAGTSAAADGGGTSGTSGGAGGEAGTTAAGSGALDGGAGTGGGDEDAGDAMVDPDAGMDAGQDSGPPMGVTMAAKVSCKDDCELKETFVGTGGSCPSVSLVADCKTTCNTTSDGTLSDCSTEFKAYYDCESTVGYKCILNQVALKTAGACNTEKAALDTCNGN